MHNKKENCADFHTKVLNCRIVKNKDLSYSECVQKL